MEIDLGWVCPNRPDCAPFIDKWDEWAYPRQGEILAMLPLEGDYMDKTLDAKSRNMVRKANKYYYYTTFNYNSRLNEIYEINTSTPHRQGKPMTVAYTSRPQPSSQWDLCNSIHRYTFIGGFNEDGVLRAYCALAILGDIAIINQILGHVDHLPNGIMNGLMAYMVAYLQRSTKCTYINYLDLTSCSVGLAKFKLSVGFEPLVVTFK